MRMLPRRPTRPLRMRPAARCSAAAVLLALTAAGCFGGSGSSAPSQASPSFHSQALAICQRTQRQVVALGAPGSASSLPELATRGAGVVALQQRELSRLQSLRPPASDAAQFQAALSALQAATAAAARLVSYAKHGDGQAVVAQQKVVTAAVASANRALTPLDLNTCSS